MPYCTVDNENGQDVKLHFEDHGEGNPVVLIHGFPFSCAAWEKQHAMLLEEGYRVIAYDRRGFGKSSHPSVGYHYDTFARDLERLLAHLNIRGATLVGHSMGTGEIARYLSTFGSERVRQAVFISPIPPFLLKTDDNPDGVDAKLFDEFKDAIEADRPAFIANFLKQFYNLGKVFGSSVSEERVRVDFAIGTSASPTATLQCVDTWLTDFRPDLHKISVPALVIQGDADKILPFEVTGAKLAETIGARLVKIEGGSHGIPWTHADEINRELLSFLEEGVGQRPQPKPIDRTSPYAGLH